MSSLQVTCVVAGVVKLLLEMENLFHVRRNHRRLPLVFSLQGRATREEMALVDVTTEIVIAAPRGRVAAFAGDPDRVPDWYVNIKSVEWKTERPAKVGTRVAFVAEFLGRRLAYTYEIVELVTGERLVMRTAEGPFPMETTYTWQPEGDHATRMTLRNRGVPRGFSVFFAPFMAFAVRRANRKDLELLKRLLETPAGGS